jgi:hypothetical protein
MTAADATQAQPAAAQYAIPLNRLIRIVRASRRKAARRRQQGREIFLIEPDDCQEYSFHDVSRLSGSAFNNRARRNRRAQALCTSGNDARLIAGRAIQTMSQPGSIKSHNRRTASDKRRRARLRTTALPTRRLVTNPHRLISCSLGRMHNTSSGCARLVPVCRTCRNRSASPR